VNGQTKRVAIFLAMGGSYVVEVFPATGKMFQ